MFQLRYLFPRQLSLIFVVTTHVLHGSQTLHHFGDFLPLEVSHTVNIPAKIWRLTIVLGRRREGCSLPWGDDTWTFSKNGACKAASLPLLTCSVHSQLFHVSLCNVILLHTSSAPIKIILILSTHRLVIPVTSVPFINSILRPLSKA